MSLHLKAVLPLFLSTVSAAAAPRTSRSSLRQQQAGKVECSHFWCSSEPRREQKSYILVSRGSTDSEIYQLSEMFPGKSHTYTRMITHIQESIKLMCLLWFSMLKLEPRSSTRFIRCCQRKQRKAHWFMFCGILSWWVARYVFLFFFIWYRCHIHIPRLCAKLGLYNLS